MINLNNNTKWYKNGLRDGVPIALGYFAVAFTLGITAKNAGLSAFEAMLTALLTNASAGGYAGFSLMAADASYLEMAVTQLVVNARYLLMAFALSQKLASNISTKHRMLIAFDVTDEIFGISVAVKGNLNPFYNYGAMTVAIPGWAFGAFFGVIMGNALPQSIVSALSVGLYGMFLAIIIPPARKNKVIAALVLISMALSLIFKTVPFLNGISEGLRVIILTVAVSLLAAILFPIKDEEGEENAA